MSRLKLYVHSIFSGYALLVAMTCYTAVSIPLALSYLPTAEYGLWAITIQLMMIVGLVDAGMSGAIGRILVDYKDHREDATYGSFLLTATLVNVVQGLLIVCMATAFSLFLPAVLKIPGGLVSAFRWLIIGQGTVLAFQLATRVFGHILVAHQRSDFGNYLNCASLLFSLAVLWLSFAAGAGIMAFLWSQVAAALLTAFLAWLCCRRLGLMPASGRLGRPSSRNFKELFAFSQNVFLLLVGIQLINASPALILTRVVGLEVAAVWAICTRPFFLLLQVITRIFDSGAPALAEMTVRGEKDKLFSRFRSLLGFCVSASVAAASFFVITNQPFVELWTQGKAGWPIWNDALLGVWLVLASAIHIHTGLAIQAKRLKRLPYVILLQGIAFVAATFLLLQMRVGGVESLLAAAVLSASALTLPYAITLTSRYLQVSWTDVAFGWLVPAGRLLVLVVPLAAALWWTTEPFPAMAKLILRVLGMVLPVSLLLFRVGVEPTVQRDLLARAPLYLKTPLRLLLGREASVPP